MIEKLKGTIRNSLPSELKNRIAYLRSLKRTISPLAERTCSICGYVGFFRGYGQPLRIDACCPECGSLERHRLLALAIERGEIEGFERQDSTVLHFAAEPIFAKLFRKRFEKYRTADLFVDSDIKLDIENIDMKDEECDIVLANHVLEHVSDYKACEELFRILKRGGLFVCQVPIIEGWDETYEDDSIVTDAGRELHYGQIDHIRYYGRDFRARVERSGLKLVSEITARAKDVVKYSLLRGEKVFVFQKPSQ